MKLVSLLICSLGFLHIQARDTRRCQLPNVRPCGARNVPRRYGPNAVSYEQCKKAMLERGAKLAECMRSAVNQITEQKMCGCTIWQAKELLVLSPASARHAASFRCDSAQDMREASCPEIARRCQDLFRVFFRPSRGNTCSDKDRADKQKLLQCDLANTDISGCGGLKDKIQSYGPFMKRYMQLQCTGCDAMRYMQSCMREKHGSAQQHACGTVKFFEDVAQCTLSKARSDDNCKPIMQLLEDVSKLAMNIDYIRQFNDTCKIVLAYEREYATWGCDQEEGSQSSRAGTRRSLIPDRALGVDTDEAWDSRAERDVTEEGEEWFLDNLWSALAAL